MQTLFLQAPSFDGYDGGAGARYQMKREVKSFWFPTWLAQAAAMVPGSRIIDAPPHGLSFKDIEDEVKSHDLIVIHTSTPSFKSDVRTVGMIRALNPTAKIGFIGAKVAVEPQESLEAAPAIDFVCRNEYEFTIKELAEGADWSTIKGLSYRDCGRQDRPQSRARNPDGHGQAAVRAPALQAAQGRELFRRLSAAPLHVLVYRPRLQVALHLLPVAADHRRAQIPLHFDRARGRRREIRA